MLILIQLFTIFFKVGLFSFGGGYVMLPMIYDEIQTFSFMPVSEFANIVALSQVTPGPIAVNAATYVGFRAAGFWGSFAATVGVSLPSFLLILIISSVFMKFKSSRTVEAVLSGIRPATVGMIASAVLFFSETSIFNGKLLSGEILRNPSRFINLGSVLIFVLTLLGAKKFKIDPIPLTILAGVAGIFIL